MDFDELARVGYQAFRTHANASAEKEAGVPGNYPHWDSLPEACKEANLRAAEAIVTRLAQRLLPLLQSAR